VEGRVCERKREKECSRDRDRDREGERERERERECLFLVHHVAQPKKNNCLRRSLEKAIILLVINLHNYF